MTDGTPGGEASRAGLFASLKGLFGTSLALAQNRLQLLGVELAEERGRLLSLLTFGAIALICLSAGLVFLAVFLTVLLWDSHRLLALGVFSALAAFSGKPAAWRLWGLLAVAMSAFGAFTAARQSWLQWNPPAFATCGRDLYGMIESFPLQSAIPMIFKGSGDCSAVDWTFLGGTIANWSFVWFLIFAGVILLTLARSASAARR